MRRTPVLVIALFALGAALALAAPMVHTPRSNGNPVLNATQTLPTASPLPETSVTNACPLCRGQSVSVPGALHLDGCDNYQVRVCGANADAGINLVGDGGLTVITWPDPVMLADGGYSYPLYWSPAPSLNESVPASAAQTQCVTFAGHVATGADWIYAAPSGIGVSLTDGGTDGGGQINVSITAGCTY